MSDRAMRRGSDPSLAGKTEAELEAMLNAYDPSNPDAPLVIEEVAAPEAPVEDVPVPPSEPPPPEPTPEPDIESDLASSNAEGERIEREALKAQLALQQAHSSRLAGEIGFLRDQLKSIPRASEPYEPQSQAEVDRLTRLEQTLESEREARLRSQVSQVISETAARLDGTWTTELAAEIQQIAPKHADQIRLAQESRDPELARQIITATILTIQAEARQSAWETKHKALVEKKAATVTAAASAKRAATVSGSGAVPAPPPKPKAFADMSPEEADSWLRANVR